MSSAGQWSGGPWQFAGNDSLSILGTPAAPHLPHWMTNNPLPQGRPWGGKTAGNTNYYVDAPDTGVTRYYDWTVSKASCAPDGVTVDCLLVNGAFPGPTIEANWGDWIEVKVSNTIADEGTAFHWHGFLQKETPWMDGVPGMTQCPIAPGSEFTYRFKADLYGTSWWHSHYSSQYASGLLGPMVVYGPLQKELSYDVDLGPVLAGDWYHQYYEASVAMILAPLPAAAPPFAANNLLNGKASFDCSKTNLPCVPDAPLSSFNFTSGKSYRLRLVNPSATAVEKITIDNHSFTVIAVDFVPVEPYETDHITLAVGQRTDVIVKATGISTDAAWLRAYMPSACSPIRGQNEVKAAIFYEDADVTKLPVSAPGPNAYNNYCGNDPLSQTVPYYAIDPGQPSVTEVLPIEFKPNGTNLLWYLANRTMRVDYNDPVLLEAKLGNLSFPEIRSVHNYGKNASVRFIIENAGPQPHPMHVHGHNVFILAEGACTRGPSASGGGPPAATKRDAGESGNCWDGTIVNPTNPARRDVHMLLPGQFIVIQWYQDNPGVWPLHCHIAWHLSSGFVWTVLEDADTIQQDFSIPSVMAETCRGWAAFTGGAVVDQIDSGL